MRILADAHTRVLKLVSRFWGNAQASIAPTAALTLIPILTAAGAAVDYSRANNFRTAMQASLDTGLVAGAKDGTTSWTQVATNVFNANLKARGGTAGTPSFTKSSDVVFNGTVTGSMPTSVLGIINIKSIPVKVTATATSADADNSCILTLDHGQPDSHISLTLNGAPVINLSGCSIRSNTSLDCNGHDGQVTWGIASGTSADCGRPKSSQPHVPDDWAKMANYITPLCNTSKAPTGVPWNGTDVLPNDSNIKTTTNQWGSKEYHICGDLNISNTVKFSPDKDTVIVIENGSLIVNDQANVSMSRTVVVLTGSDPNAKSVVDLPQSNGKSGSLLLSPPLDKSNPWQGVALFQDPKMTNTNNKWGPGADFAADGLVYLPNSNVVTDGNTKSNNAKCSKFVMNQFTTNGSVNLDFDQSVASCAAIGLKQWGGIIVRLTK
jgi:hypothetical protein